MRECLPAYCKCVLGFLACVMVVMCLISLRSEAAVRSLADFLRELVSPAGIGASSLVLNVTDTNFSLRHNTLPDAAAAPFASASSTTERAPRTAVSETSIPPRSQDSRIVSPGSSQNGEQCTMKEYFDCFAAFTFESFTWVPYLSLLFKMPFCQVDFRHECPETFDMIPAPLCHCRLQNIWQHQLRQGMPMFKKLGRMRIAFVGDSTAEQVANHFRCAAKAIGLPIKVKIYMAHTYLRFVQRRVKEQLRGLDFMIFGFGLWYNLKETEDDNRKAKGHDEVKYESDMLQFSVSMSTGFQKSGLIWLEPAVQHYPGGLFRSEFIGGMPSCSATTADHFYKASWRARVSTPIVQKHGFAVIPAFNLSYPMWTEHPFLNKTLVAGQNPHDCTHYCTNGPTLMQTVTLLFARMGLEQNDTMAPCSICYSF